MMKKVSIAKSSASVFALAMLVGATYAQDASVATQDNSGEDEETVLYEIEVIGVRGSLLRAQDIKRNSNAIVDAISAEDIGVFPDENVAEALQRIPGVAIDRSRGEGERISIRGLGPEQNLTLLNGQFIASSNQFEDEQPSRSFNFALIASEVISSAEVYKTPEARLDEGGVGGTVILKTRRPLDLADGYLFAGSAEGGYAPLADEVDPRFSLSAGWRSPDDKFGVILSGAYTERSIRGDATGPLSFSRRPVDLDSDGVLDFGTVPITTLDPTRGFGLLPADAPRIQGIETTDENGNPVIQGTQSPDGLFLPDLLANTYFPTVRERAGGSGAIEWQPTESLNFHLTGLYSQLRETGVNNNFLLLPLRTGGAGNVVEPVNNAVIENQTVISGTIPQRFTEGVNFTGLRGNVFTTALDSFDRDSMVDTFAVDLGTTWTPFDQNFEVFANVGYTRANVNADNRFFETVGFGDQTYDLSAGENGQQSVSVDLLDPTGQFFSFVNFINLDQVQDESHAQFDVTYNLDSNFFESIQTGMKARRVSQDRNQTVASFGDVAQNFLDANGIAIWGLNLARLNPMQTPDDYLSGGFDNAINAFMIPDPAAIDELFGVGNGNDSVFAGAEVTSIDEYFDITEDIYAGYVQVNFSSDVGGLNLRGNLGTRITRLERQSEANLITNGVPEPFARKDTQTDILPSFNLAADLNENLVVRFGAARTLARPTFSELSPTIVVIEETLQANSGNPDLDNFVANGYDLSAEYYYGEGNAISAATFYKDILSFTVSGQENELVPLGGDAGNLVNVLVTRPVNGGGGEIYGFELSALHYLDNLPEPFDGFGVGANYTFSESSVSDPTFSGLPGQSKHTVNTSVFYEKDSISTRVSYNYRSDFFLGVSNGQNRFAEGIQQVDFNASYTRGSTTFFIEGLNLTDEQTVENYFAVPQRIGGQGRFGRRFFFGVRYKL